MTCRRMTVKDVMRTMRDEAKRPLTAAERRIAAVTAQQTIAFVCEKAKGGYRLQHARARK